MRNLRTSIRFGLGFGLVLSLMCFVSCIGIWRLQAVAEAIDQMVRMPIVKEQLITDLYLNISNSVTRTTAISKSSDPSLGNYFEPVSIESMEKELILRKKIAALLRSDAEKELFRKMLVVGDEYRALGGELRKLRSEGKLFQARTAFEKTYIPLAATYVDHVQKLVLLQRESIASTASGIDGIYTSGKLLLISFSVLALIVSLSCAWLMTRSLLRQLGGEPYHAVRVAERIAAGDLTGPIDIESDDMSSLMYALKNMRDSLANIVQEVRTGTDAISSSSSSNAAGHVEIFSRTELQAKHLEKTAQSMNRLTSAVKENTVNACHANQLSIAAANTAHQGGIVVDKVASNMNFIKDSSRKIEEITGMINGIAFQTNILALNAAVEAARAGDSGRGFAVVASEVGNLSQRSASAAKEINQLIAETIASINAGALEVKNAAATMTEIVAGVKQLADIMANIMQASQQQSVSIEQMNKTISQIDHSTKKNSALVAQGAAAAESLQQQTSSLVDLVSVFRINSIEYA